MIIIVPVTIESGQIPANNIPDDDAPAWTATSHAVDDVVMHNEAVWASLVDNNTSEPGTADTKWFRRGPINRLRPFDQGNDTQATNPAAITYSVVPGSRIDSISFVSLDAISVTVEIFVTGVAAAVYSETRSALRSENRNTFYSWLFPEFQYARGMSFLNIPAYADPTTARIDITIDKAGGDAKVGEILFGRSWRLGTALYETSPRLKNFSIDDRDEFGNAVLVRRRASRAVTYRVAVDPEYVEFILDRMEGLTATKLLFLGGDAVDQMGTTIFGTCKDLSTPISGPKITEIEIQAEGFLA